MIKISKDMIQKGFDEGVVKLIKCPLEDSIVCEIGDSWFYFGGPEEEKYNNVDEYMKNISEDVVIADIFNALEDFQRSGEELFDEYKYYYYYLVENGIKDVENTQNVFSNLYYLKQHILMLQNIKNDESYKYINSLWNKFKDKIDFVNCNLSQLNSVILNFDNLFIKKKISEDTLEDWTCSDYDVYTDKYYHRKFWNEIPNPNIVQEIFDKISEILKTDNSNSEYMLCVYDFNDKALYFKSENEMTNFVNEYHLCPSVAFVLKENHYTELWSV